MKIVTWNVNGIRKREPEFLALVAAERPDVACLQETKASPEQLSESLTLLPEYHTFWHAAKKGYSGVSLHLRKDTIVSGAPRPRPPIGGGGPAPAFDHPPFDMESRLVHAVVGDVVFASVYVPNGGKDFAAKMTFLKEMVLYAKELREAGKKLVLCGDFNVTREERDVHPAERKPGCIGQREDERALFRELLAQGLVDVGRALAQDDDRLFTWWAPWRQMRQRNIGWRLDYVLASDELRATRCTVLRETGTSDHGAIVAELEA